MGNEKVDLVTVVKPEEKKSLLQRFEIPIDHLSYEYVSKCCEAKELERIVLILRSGEEGIFPDLIKHAEIRLEEIKPSSKVLRIEEPVITRDMLEPDDRKAIDEDLAKWMSEMQNREKDLEEGKALSLSSPLEQPEIRQPLKTALQKSISKSKTNKPKPKSIGSCDYAEWDKFDADAELDRIDLRDERDQVKLKNVQRMQKEKREEAKKFSKEAVIDKLSLTATELSVMAEQEKNIGNEAYRAGDYEEALIRYNSSIGINSTVNGYNNRAITNIKLERYENAISDCDMVLCMEYNNVTALMRRGLALEKLERNSEALIDYQTILRIEPNNKIAIAAINKLRKPCGAKKVRMKIEEEETESIIDQFKELKEEEEEEEGEIKIKRNEIVRSEICFCDRAPSFSKSPKPPPHYKSSYCLSESSINITKNKILINNKSSINKSENLYLSSRDDKLADKSPILIIEELKNEDNKNESKLKINSTMSAAGDGINNKTKNKKLDVEESIEIENNITEKEKSDINLTHKFGIGKTIENRIKVASKYERQNFREDKIEKVEKDLDCVDSPYEFLHMWQSLKNDADYKSRSKLLRSLAPEDLDVVIGNKLDGEMLSTMLRCLEENFTTPKDADVTRRFLTAFKNLRRFSIVHLFMDSNDKKVLLKIINRFEEYESTKISNELRNAYGI